jgi:hypothetical protein
MRFPGAAVSRYIRPFFAFAALALAAHRYLRAAIIVLAVYILAALAIGGWSPDMIGLSLLAQQVIFGPLAVTAIVLAILDKLLWVGAVFVVLPSANLLLGLLPLILFAIAVIISGGPPPNRPYLGAVSSTAGQAALSRHNLY